MDYSLFIQNHEEQEADISISLLETGTDMAGQFGIAVIDKDYRIRGFQEKPKKDIKTIPGDPKHVLASMGIYLFNTDVLIDSLKNNKLDDFGKEIIPRLVDTHRVLAYPYSQCNKIRDFVYETLENGERELKLDTHTRDSSYWRDVGTLDSYWNANMDLTGVDPYFNLYGRLWPVHTYQPVLPPAKFVFASEKDDDFRVGKALDSLVAPGCIVSGIVRDSILSNNVIVRSWATVEESVIMDRVVIGRHCRIKKAIIDKDNIIPANTEIGYNPKKDRKLFTVSPRGIVVVPKGYYE
jgi:glucose-1-phosphate adenylyltransferase